MTAQNGSLVLIKAGDGATPEMFTTIGGLRTSTMLLGNHILDTTNVESGVWRQLLGSAGIRSVHVNGSGAFTNSASEETVRANAFSGTINNYQFIFANGNRITGPFMITAYQRAGDYDSEETFSLALESAGTISFTTS